MKSELSRYRQLLEAVKIRIRQAQVKATLSANAEMILMYWDIGRIIAERQKSEGWGAGVIPRLSKDIRNELPELKGFSERNIGYMMRFALFIIPILINMLHFDNIFAQYYGFTEEEFDFIINYDIKYRMGKELDAYIEGTLSSERLKNEG